MKHATNTIIVVIICGAVLVAAVGIGFYIRQARLQRATAEPNDSATVDGEENPSKFLPGQGLAGRRRQLSPEQRAQRKQQREEIIKKMENMSEQEKEQFLAQMRERFGARRRGPERSQSLSEDEINELRQQFEGLRERWRNMSEQEREEVRARLRERFGRRMPPPQQAPSDLSDGQMEEPPDEPAKSDGQQNNTSEK